MKIPPPTIESVDIARLRPWPNNPRKDHAVEQIAKSIDAFGYLSPIVVQKGTYRILAGHGRLEALKRHGVTEVPVVVADVDDDKADLFTIADNKLTELADWDFAKLADQLIAADAKGLDVGLTGFTDKEVEDMANWTPKPAEQEQWTLDLPTAPVTKTGDRWECGDHFVFCGDSTDDVDVGLARGPLVEVPFDCIATDPPYAIFGSSTGLAADITDDKIVRPFFEALFRLAAAVLKKFGHAYVCCDWRSWSAVWDSAKRGGMAPKNLIVWDKGGGGLGSMYTNSHELIGFFTKPPPRQGIMGDRETGQRTVMGRSNVLKFDRPTGEAREHNAAKPLGLFEEFVKNSTDEGGLVFEPFAGSGTTLIACERLKRRCIAIDIEPKWVDVTVKRWQALTGRKARNLTRPEVVL